MKGRPTISEIVLVSFLVVLAKGKDVRYKKHEEDNAQIFTYQQVNKIIQMKGGDIYDCVDVNEQPAFNHPLLKDHKIQMKPSSLPVGMDIESSVPDSFLQVEPSIIECPIGTIPMLRSNRSGTIATHNVDGLSNDLQWETAGITYQGDIYGTRATLNVYEPKMNKNSKDFSAIWVQMNSGAGERGDKIGVGLRVSPALSGDTSVRFHIAWYDGYYKKSCIDHGCPGFVQTDHNVGLGAKVVPVSVIGGQQKIMIVRIFKDPYTKNWWIFLNNRKIGYWPTGLFEFIRDKGDSAFWGGWVEGPTASSNSPPMGSGRFAKEGFGRAAFIRNVQIAGANGTFVTREVGHGSSDPSKYTVDGFEVHKDGSMGMYFGGPGSNKA